MNYSSFKKKKKSDIKFCWNCGEEVQSIDYRIFKGIPKCPKCNVDYPEKPKLEAKLTLLQDNYLKDRSEKNMNLLFFELYNLTYNLIKGKLKNSSSHLSNSELIDRVQWTLEKLYTYYTTKPTFKMDSFCGYISQVILYPLYNTKQQKEDKEEISINAPFTNDFKGKERTLLDFMSSQSSDENHEDIILEKQHESEVLIESIEFIKTSLNKVYNMMVIKDEKYAFEKTLKLANMYNCFISGMNDRFMTELYRSTDVEMMDIFNANIEILKQNLIKSANGE